MVKALFDTNILIDHLNGIEQAAEEIVRYEDRAISVVTWIEVLAGGAAEDVATTRAFLQNFAIVDIDGAIAEATVQLRRLRRLRLPDAIIWASARTQGRLLVTRNARDFPTDDPGVRIPYAIP